MNLIRLKFEVNQNSNQEQFLKSFQKENMNIIKERKVKNIFLETRTKKDKKQSNKMKSLLLLYINLFIFIHFFLIVNAQSQPSVVTLRYNKTGPVRILNEQFSEKPNRVYINDTLLDEFSYIIYLDNETNPVRLEWDNQLTTCKNMFKDLIEIAVIDLSGFDSSLVTDMSYMFYNCSTLIEVNLTGFKTSKVTNMAGMFGHLHYLKKVNFSSFDTSNVKSFENFIRNCGNITTLDVSNFNTEKATNMAAMFRELGTIISLDLSSFNTAKVTNMYGMFSFAYKMTSLDLTSFDTSLVEWFAYFLESCQSLTTINISNFDTSSAKYMQGMFQNSVNLVSLDITNFRTHKVENMEGIFNGLPKLTSINLDFFDTSNVLNMAKMFQNCQSLTSLDLSKFNTIKVKTMEIMFCGCNNLQSLKISNFDTSKVTNMAKMFKKCSSLTSFETSNFDTTKVTTMVAMFEECNGLHILNISNFYPNECTDYSNMFFKCQNLEYVDFYNYYETQNTIYNDIIKDAFNNIQLCIHVNRQARIYLSYTDHLVEACLIPDEVEIITTQIESTFQTDIEKKTTQLESTLLTKNEIMTTQILNIEKERTTTQIIDTSEIKIHEPMEQINSIKSEISKSITSTITTQIIDTSEIKIDKMTTEFTRDYYLGSNKVKTQITDQETNIYEQIEQINSIKEISQKISYMKSEISESITSTISTDTKNFTDNNEVKLSLISSELINSFYNITSSQINYKYQDYIIIDGIYFVSGNNNSQIYNSIIEYLLKDFSRIGEKKISIKAKNEYIFELTTQINELELLNEGIPIKRNTSLLDLGECNNLLKNQYFPNINENISFIILKYEKLTNNITEKNIQYEIYEPFNHTILDLSICKNTSININIQTDLGESNQKIIERLKKLGYDVFNLNDPFYTDFCTKYTTEDGTDMTLADRKKYIYEQIMQEVQCQENCNFSSYDPDKRNLECKCKVQEEINTIDYKQFNLKKLYNTFYDVLKYSNYKVILCYKLVFDIANFSYNKGCWIIFILFILYLTQLFTYLYKKIKPIKLDIAIYLFKKKKYFEKEKIKDDNVLVTENAKISSSRNIQFPPKKRKTVEFNGIVPKNKYGGRNSEKHIFDSKLKGANTQLNTDFNQTTTKTKLYKYSKFSSKTVLNGKDIKQEMKIFNDEILLKYVNIDNYELNNLEYDEAIILDKRNFFQIYWSILKREHLILFTFCHWNDYNLYYVKFAKFFFLIATDMAMNVFFFSDETMNKLYLSYGKYDFVQQIPQIIYSKICSNFIEVFLCFLSLTDKHYYQIKSLSKSEKYKIFEIIKCFRIKLIIFFLFTFILFLFYWYLVTAFCAVYENTQIVYIKDFLMSFVLGIFEPLIIYIFPAFFRLLALRCKCGEYMYSLSEIIPIF